MCTITDFIKYVNNRLKAEYTVFIESGINKPKFNLDIIGREEELNIIEKSLIIF
ncbi:Putative diguanylate cyclase part 3 [Clostridium neonatale]|nr:Putative diguanylate cyclase part 3 [Clostridium neonatale]